MICLGMFFILVFSEHVGSVFRCLLFFKILSYYIFTFFFSLLTDMLDSLLLFHSSWMVCSLFLSLTFFSFVFQLENFLLTIFRFTDAFLTMLNLLMSLSKAVFISVTIVLFFISSLSIYFSFRVFISLLKFPICPHLWSTFSTRAFSIEIIDILNSTW